jgi:hypothetical protein
MKGFLLLISVAGRLVGIRNVVPQKRDPRSEINFHLETVANPLGTTAMQIHSPQNSPKVVLTTVDELIISQAGCQIVVSQLLVISRNH